MQNQVCLKGKHPLTLLEELCVPNVSPRDLAVRDNPLVKRQQSLGPYYHKAQQVFRRAPKNRTPVINIYNFNFYFGNTMGDSHHVPESSSAHKPSSAPEPYFVPRGFAGDFPEPVLVETDPLQSVLTDPHPLLDELMERGTFSSEYSRAVELVGAILAEIEPGKKYLAEAALVEWPTGVTTNILGIPNTQPTGLREIRDLKSGQLSFTGFRPSPIPEAPAYKDPNVTFYGRNGKQVESRQRPEITFIVKNCLVRFLK